MENNSGNELTGLLNEAERILSDVQEAERNPFQSELLKDLLSNGAIDYLGLLSNHAGDVSRKGETTLRTRYARAVQGLIDFCEQMDHPNILKEHASVSNIKLYFNNIRVPQALNPSETNRPSKDFDFHS
jgi:hypothetical protein